MELGCSGGVLVGAGSLVPPLPGGWPGVGDAPVGALRVGVASDAAVVGAVVGAVSVGVVGDAVVRVEVRAGGRGPASPLELWVHAAAVSATHASVTAAVLAARMPVLLLWPTVP